MTLQEASKEFESFAGAAMSEYAIAEDFYCEINRALRNSDKAEVKQYLQSLLDKVSAHYGWDNEEEDED